MYDYFLLYSKEWYILYSIITSYKIVIIMYYFNDFI